MIRLKFSTSLYENESPPQIRSLIDDRSIPREVDLLNSKMSAINKDNPINFENEDLITDDYSDKERQLLKKILEEN